MKLRSRGIYSILLLYLPLRVAVTTIDEYNGGLSPIYRDGLLSSPSD